MPSIKTMTRQTIAILAALSMSAPAVAQQNGKEEAPTFGEMIDVRVINLEVVVTHKGERVTGLSSDDFRLLVDGQEVPVEFFTEVSEGRAVRSRDVAAAVPALAPGEAVGTRYLVFIDDFFAIPSYRNQALSRLADQLSLLGPEDRMAIVAFDGREVEMLSSWSRSLPQLESALEQARQRRAFGLQRQSERRRLDSLARFGNPNRRFANANSSGRGFYNYDSLDLTRMEELRWQVSRVVQGATSALRAFARPPGRKAMLLLSGGWPSASLNYVVGSFFPTVSYGQLSDQRIFDPLIDTANRLGYTLYPVDLNGDPGSFGGAQHGHLFEATRAAARDDERDRLEEDALYYLASTTGGRAFIDGARFSALERTIEDTRSYYWLGFSPTWEENDRRHEVKVKMLRKGLKVRTRKSFSDLSRQSEITMMVESAQLFDLPLPGQGELVVIFGTPAKDGHKKVSVPVRLEIPLDQVTLLPDGKGYAIQLELRVAATDVDGHTAEIPVVLVELYSNGDVEGQVAIFETQLRLRAKPHRLLVSLYDPPSGNLLAKRVEWSL